MKTPLFHFLLGIVTLLLASCAVQRQSPSSAGNAPPRSVLFIGNSYSFKVPEKFGQAAASHGKPLRIGQVTHGGWSLEQHVKNEETLRKIREGNWDVVVIQEQSRIPSQPIKRVYRMFPHVRTLAEEARKAGAIPVLYQTWGRRDGDDFYPGNDDFYPGNDDFHAMNQRLRDGYRLAAEYAGGSTVVPVGDAWEREISAGRGAALYQADGSHATAHGDELTAQVFFETLFSETGW